MSRHRTVTPIAADLATARGHRVFAALLLAVLALWVGPLRAQSVPPVLQGIDMFITSQCGAPLGGTFADFSKPPGPIPPNFFDPGSDPFAGTIPFTGQPLLTSPPNVIDSVDTIVERLESEVPPLSCGLSDTVMIEILALRLKSCGPITVTYFGGTMPELWDVDAALSSICCQTPGAMQIHHDCTDGGTFTAMLPVTPKIVFTRQSDSATRTLDLCVAFPFQSTGHWTYAAPGLGDLTTPGGFLVDSDDDGIAGNGVCGNEGPVAGTSNFFPGTEAFPCFCTAPADHFAGVATIERTPTGSEQHMVYPPLAITSPVCGDGIVEPGEQCDPPGFPSSACGAFVVCGPDCQCPGPCPLPGSATPPHTCQGGTQNGLDCCSRQDQAACETAGGQCVCPCIHADPTTITFGPPDAKLDQLKSHGRVTIFNSVDVVGSGVTWLLANAQGPFYTAGLPPNALTPKNLAANLFRYYNPNAKSEGGIYKAQIKTQGHTSYGYRIEAYGDMSGATDPAMELQVNIGNQPLPASYLDIWRRTKSGWAAHALR